MMVQPPCLLLYPDIAIEAAACQAYEIGIMDDDTHRQYNVTIQLSHILFVRTSLQHQKRRGPVTAAETAISNLVENEALHAKKMIRVTPGTDSDLIALYSIGSESADRRGSLIPESAWPKAAQRTTTAAEHPSIDIK